MTMAGLIDAALAEAGGDPARILGREGTAGRALRAAVAVTGPVIHRGLVVTDTGGEEWYNFAAVAGVRDAAGVDVPQAGEV